MSIAHPVPTDFCFTSQMLYGYTTVAPMGHFIEYLLETSGIRPSKPSSKSSACTKKGCKVETGEAQLNGDCVYEADEIDLILPSDRRRIDKYKDTDLDLGYGGGASQMGHEWPNCNKSWLSQNQSTCLVGCIANTERSYPDLTDSHL